MKTFFKTILLAFTLIYSYNSSFAQVDSYGFKRKLDKSESENYYSIPLLPEVTARCKSNLNDIRLFCIKEKDTLELPYIFEWLGTKNEQAAIPFDLINDTHNEKCCSYVTLKFNKRQIINQIKLDVANLNFDKSLLIEGSNDGRQWFTIKEHLRMVGFQNSLENFFYTTLNFKNSEYTYFRLKLDDDASKSIEIKKAYAFENKSRQGNYTELKNLNWKQNNDPQKKISELIIDFPFPFLINHITLKSNTKNDFYRNINIYASSGTYHTPKGDLENWYLVTTSVFSSLDTNSFKINNEKSKKIKLEIINYDNESIEISEIKVYAEQCRLISKLPSSGSTYLVYGRENENVPSYDLIHFKEKIPKQLTEIKYGAELVRLPVQKSDNSLIKNKNWLWVAMRIVILIIGYFALTMLKRDQNL